MNLKEYKVKAMKSEEFRKEYERFDLFFEVGELFMRFKAWAFSRFRRKRKNSFIDINFIVDESLKPNEAYITNGKEKVYFKDLNK
jgi:hypothetical protein